MEKNVKSEKYVVVLSWNLSVRILYQHQKYIRNCGSSEDMFQLLFLNRSNFQDKEKKLYKNKNKTFFVTLEVVIITSYDNFIHNVCYMSRENTNSKLKLHFICLTIFLWKSPKIENFLGFASYYQLLLSTDIVITNFCCKPLLSPKIITNILHNF